MFNLVCRCQQGKHLLSKVTKADHIDRSAAISARICQSIVCRTGDCDRIPTGTKVTSMVIIGPGRRQDAEDEEMPDWCDQGQQDDDWHIASYKEIELRLRKDLNVRNLHAIDVVSIGTKSDPIPMKELDDERRMMVLKVKEKIADTTQAFQH